MVHSAAWGRDVGVEEEGAAGDTGLGIGVKTGVDIDELVD